MSSENFLLNQLREKGLKATPQRIAVLRAFESLKNHPSTDNIIEFIKENYPHIAIGTVYKILDNLVEVGLVSRVKTEKDNMRYDNVLSNHHHLYCAETDRIEDYFDEDLNKMLEDYFVSKSIDGFDIKEIRLQIKGHFTNKT